MDFTLSLVIQLVLLASHLLAMAFLLVVFAVAVPLMLVALIIMVLWCIIEEYIQMLVNLFTRS
jgi:hypothetical protein